jgi:hypothetical protein
MPTGTFQYQTEEDRLAIEAAIAFVAEMRALARAAPAGQVLPLCEALALEQGRDLLRSTLQSAAQSRIDSAEKKGARRAAAARAPAPSASSGAAARGT